MSATLVHNSYGKSAVRLTKVVRNGPVHKLFEIDAAVFSMGVARRRLLEVDPQAQHALGLFPQAEKLLTMVKTKTTRTGQGRQ